MRGYKKRTHTDKQDGQANKTVVTTRGRANRCTRLVIADNCTVDHEVISAILKSCTRAIPVEARAGEVRGRCVLRRSVAERELSRLSRERMPAGPWARERSCEFVRTESTDPPFRSFHLFSSFRHHPCSFLTLRSHFILLFISCVTTVSMPTLLAWLALLCTLNTDDLVYMVRVHIPWPHVPTSEVVSQVVRSLIPKFFGFACCFLFPPVFFYLSSSFLPLADPLRSHSSPLETSEILCASFTNLPQDGTERYVEAS